MYANLLRDADLYFTSESSDNSLGFSGLSVGDGDGLNVDQKRHYTFLIFKYFISKNLESDCFENVGLDLLGGAMLFEIIVLRGLSRFVFSIFVTLC